MRGGALCDYGPRERVLPSIRNTLVRSMMAAHASRMYPGEERTPLNPGWQKVAPPAFEPCGFTGESKVASKVPRVDGKVAIFDPVERDRKEKEERERRKAAERAGHV